LKISSKGFLVLLYFLVLAPIVLHSMPYSQSSGIRVVRAALLVDIAPPWDTIDSGVAECLVDAVRSAEEREAILIYRVNSYGGYMDPAFTIAEAVYRARTITIAYVENKAFSAGTLIILPADYVALQRGSAIGAMQPVLVNPVTGEIMFVNESKIIEPILNKARIYAEAKGRNTTLVEEFIYKARVVNSRAAVELSIADAEVENFEDLLSRLYGLRIEKNGVMYELQVTPGNVEVFPCSIRSRALSFLSNPYVSNVLVSIGVLAVIFGLVSGRLAVLPLALALVLLGLVGVGINPNIVSFILMLLGAVLLAVELFVLPGFGIVGVSGIVLLTLGFALLPAYIPTGVVPTEEYVLALRAFIITTSLILGGFFGLVTFKIVQVKRKKPITYTPEGKIGVALDNIKPGTTGFVKVEGEYWRAVALDEIKAGESVVVVSMREDGVLVVKKKST
jgi:membrane-bound serine protease (ClpP class)